MRSARCECCRRVQKKLPACAEDIEFPSGNRIAQEVRRATAFNAFWPSAPEHGPAKEQGIRWMGGLMKMRREPDYYSNGQVRPLSRVGRRTPEPDGMGQLAEPCAGIQLSELTLSRSYSSRASLTLSASNHDSSSTLLGGEDLMTALRLQASSLPLHHGPTRMLSGNIACRTPTHRQPRTTCILKRYSIVMVDRYWISI